MEQTEILELNKIIAEFDGWTFSHDRFFKDMSYTDGDGGLHESCVTENKRPYYSNWNLLMPVVRKFDYLAESKTIPNSADFEFWCDKIDDAVTRTYEIGPIFKIMVEAIEWYNSLKNK